MKCFYHKADLDGICSGAIVHQKYPNCEMLGFDYGDSIKDNYPSERESIILVDISLPREEMMNLVNRESKVIWIDHHNSVIVDSVEHEYDKIRGFRKVGVGACELTWRYFFEGDVPNSVHLLANYDVWNHTDRRVVPFQYGVKTLGLNVYDPTWIKIFSDELNEDLIKTGRCIVRYVKQEAFNLFQRTLYIDIWNNYNVIFINSCITDNMLYALIPMNLYGHDIIVSYYRISKDKYKVSIRAVKDSIDVSLLAAEYGGGGHKGAAGFICEKLPWT
jgi:nanoRNase/pAp phosphatase (c-di-AMP/oligoRNAs hydrolase)